jgi:hypothetical protein
VADQAGRALAAGTPTASGHRKGRRNGAWR